MVNRETAELGRDECRGLRLPRPGTPTVMSDHERAADDVADEISRLARSTGRTVAVAESLTGGRVCATQDDQEPGTVFLAVVDGSGPGGEPVRRQIDGDPGQVCAATVIEALVLLVERLRLAAVTSSGPVGSG